MNDISQVKDYLLSLQNRIVAELEEIDGKQQVPARCLGSTRRRRW